MNTDRTKLLGEAPVRKAIFVMATPVVAGMMVQVLYNLVDTFFLLGGWATPTNWQLLIWRCLY